MGDCIFCKIIAGTIATEKLAENSEALAFKDLHPQAKIHILIVTKQHVASLNELSASDRQKILPSMYELADSYAQQAGFKSTGYRTVINNQAASGQTVFHLHMHVLAGSPLKGGFGA